MKLLQPDWLTAIGTIAGAVAVLLTVAVALTLAIWGDVLKRVAFKPKLDVSIEMRPPFCHKVQLIEGLTVGATAVPDAEVMPAVPDQPSTRDRPVYHAYYFRLGVTNVGNTVAKEVGVRILGLKLWNDLTQAFIDDEDFRPFNLRWSHVRRVTLPRIEPHSDLRRFCDLAHVFQVAQDRLLEFDTEVTPGQVRPGVWPTKKPGGTYLVLLAITADDGYLVRKSVRIAYTGQWYDDAAQMFQRGIQINVQS